MAQLIARGQFANNIILQRECRLEMECGPDLYLIETLPG
jgi:hypothetical protein